MLRAAAALPNSGLSQQLDFHELGWLRIPSGGDAVPSSVVKTRQHEACEARRIEEEREKLHDKGPMGF
jgi:hypothetical protein